MLPETQAPQRPADVSGQHPLVHPVDLPPHVSEGQKGRRSQGPETGLLFLQPRGHAVPALPALRHPEGSQSSHRLLHIEHPLSLIHISEPTRLRRISYAVICLKKKKNKKKKTIISI